MSCNWRGVTGHLSIIVGVVAILLFGSVGLRAQEQRDCVGTDLHHVVASGENLFSIARHYGLAIEHLAFANDLSCNSLAVAPGTTLIIPKRRILPDNPPYNGLVVNLPERGVFLFREGEFEKFYPVAIGQCGRFQTPLGDYSISCRTKDPTWAPPEWAGMGEKLVPAGPENPLGDRWIGLTAPGIGLHSTTSPMSIGQAVSHGCMRMYPESVRELFDKVYTDWPVRIEYETAKVGYDRSSGVYCLAVFPDVYQRQGPKATALNALAMVNASFDAVLEDSFFKPTGVAKELDNLFPISIMIDNDYSLSPAEPMFIDGAIWASARVAQELNLTVDWSAKEEVVRISRGSILLFFPLRKSYALKAKDIPLGASAKIAGLARRQGGNILIPLRPVLNAFSINSEWDSVERVLHLTSLP